jgi:signal transduction histidine kinase
MRGILSEHWGKLGNTSISQRFRWPIARIYHFLKIMKTRRKILLPRLTWRITLWIFVSILGIEAVLLLPSINNRRQELLGNVRMGSEGVATTLKQQAIVAQASETTLLTILKQLQTTHYIQGAALYRSGQVQAVQIIGEAPQLNPNGSTSFTSNDRYEVGHALDFPQQSYRLVLRHDMAPVNASLAEFIVRVSLLVLVIALVVSGILMLVLQYQIIRPIILLRWDLLQAGESITHNLERPEFVSDRYAYQDEFADVITAFRQMFHQISTEVGARKQSESTMGQSAAQLQHALRELQSAQANLVQGEKMSSLGQLVAGVAHEVNNPMNFIYGNLEYVGQVTQDLLEIIQQYQSDYPQMSAAVATQIEAVDLAFVRQDLPKVIKSMQDGAQRIQGLVLSFRNFSRLDESERKRADLNAGLESTLVLIQHRLQATPQQAAIQLIKQYGNLPEIECSPAQLNQVFLAILNNAIDALEANRTIADTVGQSNEDQPMIEIKTQVMGGSIRIEMTDNGVGMDAATQRRAFDPFFTTKDVGEGQGLGLAISYQIIVDGHSGELLCQSVVNRGSRFTIHLPIAATD